MNNNSTKAIADYFDDNICNAGGETSHFVCWKVFSDYSFENKRILDFGCGGGDYSLCFAEKNISDISVYDISGKSLLETKNKISEKFPNKKIFVVNSEDEFSNYDVIWCKGVIYYSDHPEKIIADCINHLNKNGLLFITFNRRSRFGKILNYIRKILSFTPLKMRKNIIEILSNFLYYSYYRYFETLELNKIKLLMSGQFLPIKNFYSKEEISALFSKYNVVIEKIFDPLEKYKSSDFGVLIKKN